jgi:isoamylase
MVFSLFAGNSMVFANTDTKRPTAPSGLIATTTTNNSIALKWNAAKDNVAVTGYNVYRNGVRVLHKVNALTAQLTSLQASTRYRIVVKALDAANNLSVSSNVLFVTTSVTSGTGTGGTGTGDTGTGGTGTGGTGTGGTGTGGTGTGGTGTGGTGTGGTGTGGNIVDPNVNILEPRTGMKYNQFLTIRAESKNPAITKLEVFYAEGTQSFSNTPIVTQNATPGTTEFIFSLDLTAQVNTTQGKVRIIAKNASNSVVGTSEITGIHKTNLDTNLANLKDGSTVLKDTNGKTSGSRFTVWSRYATKGQVWIYDKENVKNGKPLKVLELIKQTPTVLDGSMWVADAMNDVAAEYGAGTYYGFRFWGPNFTYNTEWRPGTEFGFKQDVDKDGHRFNPNKLLSDPYARTISHDPEVLDNRYYTGAGHRQKDSAAIAPKSIVYDPQLYTGPQDKKLGIHYKDTIFYEVHVKGYTADASSGVANPGTYKGFVQKLDHLNELGVNSVEFLPIHESPNEVLDSNGGNYWSYMTTNFFSPDRKYSSDKSPFGPIHEFKDMVKAIHDSGKEVILDVVYNHTAEGGIIDKIGITGAVMLNFKGIDNRSYYSLISKNSGNLDDFLNITGCGNTFNVKNKKAQQHIIDSLQYWVDDMHIDGFRYDLAAVLGNSQEHNGFTYDKTQLLTRILNEFPTVKHIAEPWTAGSPGGYQVGNFPYNGTVGYSEWQDRFRDTVRKVVRGDAGLIGDLTTRIAGSDDLYGDDGRKPYHSISKVTAHDGFTMNDLVSYNVKNNLQAAPFGPSDGGSNDNHSWDTNGNEALRAQQIRNFATYNLLAAGTPMVLGGDEFRRTQRGNNNAYNLDTIASWYDWSLKTKHDRMFKFYQGIIKLRKDHPVFKRTTFFTGKDNDNDGIIDISWQATNYRSDPWADPNNRTLGWRLDGSKAETKADVDDNDFFMIANHGTSDAAFQLPPNNGGKKWYRVIETNSWAENNATIKNNIEVPGQEDVVSDGTWTNTRATSFGGNNSYRYTLGSRAMAVFMEK